MSEDRMYRVGFSDMFEVGLKILVPLSEHFNVPLPLLDFRLGTSKKRSGVYYRRAKLIEILKEDDWDNTLLHEFAHHLDYETRGKSNHDRVFAGHLWRIAKKHYGNALDYTWGLEYPRVRKYVMWRVKQIEKFYDLQYQIECLDLAAKFSEKERDDG